MRDVILEMIAPRLWLEFILWMTTGASIPFLAVAVAWAVS